MKRFIDREQELHFLESEYARDGSSLIILYGRRRVGKTTLLNEFMRHKPSLYFLASEETESQNRRAFQAQAAGFTDNQLLQNAKIDQWDLLFQALADFQTGDKKLIIMDEFQYLGKSNPAFPSIFQRIWDTRLKETSIMVVLCGSLISMMESQTLNYTSPLYGRRTGQIKLKQIPFRYYQEFYPNQSQKALIERYSITGGIPKYIELFQGDGDIYRAIEKNILNQSSFLYDEAHFLLQREVTEVGNYFSIIKSIAAGNHNLSKIAATMELKQTSLPKYLNTLINLDILDREVPVTEENPEKSKRGLYRIKDNYLMFWFQFIYPNLHFIESGHPEIVMSRIRESLTDRHISTIYENVSIEKMWQLNAEAKWPFHFDRAGRWWDNHAEVDIVAYDSKGKDMIFGECKYWTKKVGQDVLVELEEKSNLISWKIEDRRNWFVLFSISGFTDDLIGLAQTRSDLMLCQ